MSGSLWNRCFHQLEAEMVEQQFNTWVRPLQVVMDGTELRLFAPNRFVAEWVQQNVLPRINDLCARLTDSSSGEQIPTVSLEVGSKPQVQASEPAAPREAAPAQIPAKSAFSNSLSCWFELV